MPTGAEKDSNNNSRLILNIIDSIQFDTGNDFVVIEAYNEHSFLGKNARGDKLYLFDGKGNPKRILNELGEGPLEYREILNYGLSTTDDIVVYDGSKVLSFSNTSNEIKICPVDKTEMLPELNTSRLFIDEDGRYFFASTTEANPSNMRYFETVHTFTRMETSCSYKAMGGYPEQSMFREKVFITGYEPRIWMLPYEQKIYQLFRFEKKIYVFDSNTNELIQTIPINPDHFGNIIHKKEDSIENIMYSLQRNPKLLDFVVGEKYIAIYYMPGLQEEDISASSVGYNEKMRTLARRFLSVYDRNGAKIGPDISLNIMNHYFIGFDRNGHLLLQKQTKEESVVVYQIELVLPTN